MASPPPYGRCCPFPCTSVVPSVAREPVSLSRSPRPMPAIPQESAIQRSCLGALSSGIERSDPLGQGTVGTCVVRRSSLYFASSRIDTPTEDGLLANSLANLMTFGWKESLDEMSVTGEYSGGFPCMSARRHNRIFDGEVAGEAEVRPQSIAR